MYHGGTEFVNDPNPPEHLLNAENEGAGRRRIERRRS